ADQDLGAELRAVVQLGGEQALTGRDAFPRGGVEHVYACVGGGTGLGGRGGVPALFEAGGLSLVAAVQLVERHLPIEAGKAGSGQVRIGTADGAHGIALEPVAAAVAAMAGR